MEQEEEKLAEGARFQNDQIVQSSSEEGGEEFVDDDQEEQISDDGDLEVKINPFKH